MSFYVHLNMLKDLFIKTFFFLSLLVNSEIAWANETIPSLDSLISIQAQQELSASLFPAYLRPAFTAFQAKGNASCSKELSKIKINAYTAEAEKFFLLKALCLESALGEARNIEVQNLIQSALKEKASSSDVLFIAAVALAENRLFELAFQKMTDALWFKSFKQVPLKDFNFVKAKLELIHMQVGAANESLNISKQYGFKGRNINLIELETKLLMGDRVQAIKLARALKAEPVIVQQSYLVRALILTVNPAFHMKDIEEAALISQQIKDKISAHPETAIAASKASLYFKDYETAKTILLQCSTKFPEDTRLQSLIQQVKAEEELASLKN
jgi:hypothetical protein